MISGPGFPVARQSCPSSLPSTASLTEVLAREQGELAPSLLLHQSTNIQWSAGVPSPVLGPLGNLCRFKKEVY